MIAFTSDLRLGITTENALAELAKEMRAARPAALIRGGDIGIERAKMAPIRARVNGGGHDNPNWVRID